MRGRANGFVDGADLLDPKRTEAVEDVRHIGMFFAEGLLLHQKRFIQPWQTIIVV